MVFSNILDLLTGRALSPPPRIQFAALPYRTKKKTVEYLLVTSRDTGRWIIPKGWPLSGGDVAETVMTEAWEEAGIYGKLHGEPAGQYSYDKKMESHSVRCRVIFYPVLVTKLAKDFPERNERQREWLSATEAAVRIQEPDLRELFESGRLDALINRIEHGDQDDSS
ncbi:NUDIX hydrolase [Hoeflea sp. CAU 1731]